MEAVPRLLTKSRKKKVLIRNDGVYVISGIFAEQTLAFAVKMHSRPGRWPQIFDLQAVG